jgi:lipopolysaccharide biosynthesis glycosyltransferase
MLENASKKYKYKLYVLNTDITYQNKKLLHDVVSKFENASLEFINMDNRFEDLWSNFKYSGYYSKEVLYKLLVPSIFEKYDKIIITDVDVVFTGDISDSYFSITPDENICFAGIRHIQPKNTWLDDFYKGYEIIFGEKSTDKLKVCGGYLIANLNYLRINNFENIFLEYLKGNSRRLIQAEQDVINFCCNESQIRFLPLNNLVCTYAYDLFDSHDKYNTDKNYSSDEIKNALDNPIQIHYATKIKPWNDPTCSKSDIWYKYLIKSGTFYDFVRKKKALSTNAPDFLDKINSSDTGTKKITGIKVSVLCCVYNHELFLSKTLDGIVGQITNFTFEVILSDDGSTDSSQDIIKSYRKKYPNILWKCILRDTNIGVGANYYDALSQVSGEYLAVCDGDDFWIDSYKLQKQVNFLEVNKEYNICCSSFIRNEINVDQTNRSIFSVKNYISTCLPEKKIYNFSDLLNCRFIASCTMMLRWKLKDNIPEFLKHYQVIDFPLALIHAATGGIGVLDDIFAQYNAHCRNITNNENFSVANDSMRVISEVDQFLEYQLHRTVNDYVYMMKAQRGTHKSIRPHSKWKKLRRGIKSHIASIFSCRVE